MKDLIKDQESLAREIRSLRTGLAPRELTYFNKWWSESLRNKRMERLKKQHLKRAGPGTTNQKASRRRR